MARKQAIPTNEEIQKRFEKCYGFNNQIGLYDQVKVNEDFYIGNQWEGVEANGLPTLDRKREEVILQNVVDSTPERCRPYALEFFKEMMKLSRDYQDSLK